MHVSDAPSLRLAIHLLQQVLEEIEYGMKGKERADEPQDIVIAIEAFRFEAARVKQIAADQEHATMVSTASIVTPISPCTRTRNTQCTVAGPSLVLGTPPKPSTAAIDELADQVKIYIDQRQKRLQRIKFRIGLKKFAACIAGQDPKDKLSIGIATCGHAYCRGCLAGLFAPQ